MKFGSVVQEGMLFKDILYLEVWQHLCSVDWDRLSAVRSKAVVLLLLTFCLMLLPFWESVIVMFCCTLLYVNSSIAIILMRKSQLVA